MSIAIGIVIGLIIGGVGIFLSTSSKEQKLEAQLERSTKALKEAEVLQQQQAQEIQQLKQSPSQMQEIEQSYQIQIQAIEQSYQEQSKELSQAKTRLIELEQNEQQIRQTYQNKLEALEQTYQARLQEMLQQVQESAPISEVTQAHIQQIDQSYQTKLREQQQAHQQAINELEKAHDEGDLPLDEWKDQETSDVLNSGSLLEEVTLASNVEKLQPIEELPDFPEISPNNLSDFVHDTTEVLSLEKNGEKKEEKVSELFQEKKSEDLDFFEMLPIEEETTEDLSEVLTKDKKNPFADFFELETKETTSDSDELFASFIETNESEENLTNLLQTDDESKSQKTDPFE